MGHQRSPARPLHAVNPISQQSLGGLDVLVGKFWRTISGAAGAPSGGEARLSALPDQAALEFC
jgi:hypothetical protein